MFTLLYLFYSVPTKSQYVNTSSFIPSYIQSALIMTLYILNIPIKKTLAPVTTTGAISCQDKKYNNEIDVIWCLSLLTDLLYVSQRNHTNAITIL